jgi:acyl-CoA thioesterase
MTDGAEREIAPDLAAELARDPWSRAIGIEYLAIARGHCRAALTLAPGMVNFQGRPHGGVIFTLADAAFAAACNSHGVPAVALSVTISFVATTAPSARLVAEARELRQGARAGFYDVTVRTDDGRLVASAHCVAHRVRPAD